MKKISSIGLLALFVALFGGIMSSCSDFTPTGMPENIPNLPKATSIQATVEGHDVTVNWTLPNAGDMEGVTLYQNAVKVADLPVTASSYVFKGQEFTKEYVYTVKVRYEGGYVSEGISATAVLPEEVLPDVTDLKATVKGRKVTLTWTLPDADRTDATAIRIVRNNDLNNAIYVPANTTTYTLGGQPMDTDLTYKVQMVYDTYYAAAGASTEVFIEYYESKVAYLLLANSPAALPDDDERAAAQWFEQSGLGDFVSVSQLADLDTDTYSVLWIEIDRVGLGLGWERLPQASSPEAIEAISKFSANGGSLYLSNMATQLTAPLHFVPEGWNPTVFGDGNGGSGDDVWVINAFLGWDFRNGADQGFYDRTAHAIYKGLTFEDPNNYGYNTLPLIGPGQREDHNCLWDCNIYGRGGYADVIKNFEVTTNSLVLATWGHVRDHCVAGLVEFYSNADHGRCIANGFAAYEWNQNSGANPYQHNIEQLTNNILNYLK